MTLFSPRLPHVLPRKALAQMLLSTYAEAMSVDDEEAHERLTEALDAPGVLDDLYRGISAGLAGVKGPRTTPDALLDKLSAGVETRRNKVRPAPSTAGLAAVLVRLNLELGLAPEPMRATLATDRGRAALDAGLAELGGHLVKELLK